MTQPKPSSGPAFDDGRFELSEQERKDIDWLIALMVWMLPGAGTNRLPVTVTLAYIVGIAGLSHVVAGSTEVMYLVTTGGLSFWAFAGATSCRR